MLQNGSTAASPELKKRDFSKFNVAVLLNWLAAVFLLAYSAVAFKNYRTIEASSPERRLSSVEAMGGAMSTNDRFLRQRLLLENEDGGDDEFDDDDENDLTTAGRRKRRPKKGKPRKPPKRRPKPGERDADDDDDEEGEEGDEDDGDREASSGGEGGSHSGNNRSGDGEEDEEDRKGRGSREGQPDRDSGDQGDEDSSSEDAAAGGTLQGMLSFYLTAVGLHGVLYALYMYAWREQGKDHPEFADSQFPPGVVWVLCSGVLLLVEVWACSSRRLGALYYAEIVQSAKDLLYFPLALLLSQCAAGTFLGSAVAVDRDAHSSHSSRGRGSSSGGAGAGAGPLDADQLEAVSNSLHAVPEQDVKEKPPPPPRKGVQTKKAAERAAPKRTTRTRPAPSAPPAPG